MRIAIAVLVAGLAGEVAHAQDAAMEFPATCRAGGHAGHDMSGGAAAGATMPGMEGLDAGHKALMESMTMMNGPMMEGMMQPAMDKAFLCGMIAHHQGALAMARAEVAHGDDPASKALAEKIIAAQMAEIAEMVKMVEGMK